VGENSQSQTPAAILACTLPVSNASAGRGGGWRGGGGGGASSDSDSESDVVDPEPKDTRPLEARVQAMPSPDGGQLAHGPKPETAAKE
jgi:hypothetical protein